MAARRFRWAPLLRLAIGLALIAFLSRAIGWDTLQSSLIPLRNHPGWIIAGIGLTFLALLWGSSDGMSCCAPWVSRRPSAGPFRATLSANSSMPSYLAPAEAIWSAPWSPPRIIRNSAPKP